MVIDTGCTDLSITPTIADRLIASGQATYGEDVEYTLAGGSTHTNKTVRIATVAIGGHVLHNAHAGIGPDGAPLLLGFTILQQISPKFSIDTVAGVLIFG
jgi:predicted aspartyl protease